jgi:hypothetical protein
VTRSFTKCVSPGSRYAFVRGELAPRNLRICLGEVGAFLGRQFDDGLLLAGHLRQQAGKLVLHLRGKAAHAVNRAI